MAWTKVAKPSISNWSNQNPSGKEQYDQSSLTYDDVSTYYDGLNPNQWTGVAKPTNNNWVKVAKPT